MQNAAVPSWRCFEAIVWLAHQLLRRKMSPVWPSRSSLNLLGGDQELWSSDTKFYKIVGIDRTTEVQSYASIPTILSPRCTQHRYPPEIDLPRLAGRAAWIPQWRHQHRAWCIYRQVFVFRSHCWSRRGERQEGQHKDEVYWQNNGSHHSIGHVAISTISALFMIIFRCASGSTSPVFHNPCPSWSMSDMNSGKMITCQGRRMQWSIRVLCSFLQQDGRRLQKRKIPLPCQRIAVRYAAYSCKFSSRSRQATMARSERLEKAQIRF